MEFTPREFEGEADTMFTFEGHNGAFCIMLNAKCIHSVKTKAAHEKKINSLATERGMIEIINN